MANLTVNAKLQQRTDTATNWTSSNIISINILFVDHCVENNELYDLEYFLLHEIRHVFQHLDILDYQEGRKYCCSKDLIEKWIYEEKNYIKALDENGLENEGYPLQDIEKDAYAFSYAVMKHKYGEDTVSKLYLPSVYGKDFFILVNEWVKQFREEKEAIKN